MRRAITTCRRFGRKKAARRRLADRKNARPGGGLGDGVYSLIVDGLLVLRRRFARNRRDVGGVDSILNATQALREHVLDGLGEIPMPGQVGPTARCGLDGRHPKNVPLADPFDYRPQQILRHHRFDVALLVEVERLVLGQVEDRLEGLPLADCGFHGAGHLIAFEPSDQVGLFIDLDP